MNDSLPSQPDRPALSAVTVSVNEIFHSIQGESTWAGLPCVFVRLAGCPLRCDWCDTTYAFSEGSALSIAEILRRCAEYRCGLVEITGGEPLSQRGTPALAQALLDAGYTVLCETSGALPIDVLPEGVVRIMDIKCPGSGESAQNDWGNVGRLRPQDEVKFVIADRADYDWAKATLLEHTLATRCHSVLFAPVMGRVEPRELAAWILADGLPVRFQLQLHKIIWDPAQRGV